MEQKLVGTENIEGRCELGDRYYGRLKDEGKYHLVASPLRINHVSWKENAEDMA